MDLFTLVNRTGRGFKVDLIEQRNVRTSAPLPASTIDSTLGWVRAR